MNRNCYTSVISSVSGVNIFDKAISDSVEFFYRANPGSAGTTHLCAERATPDDAVGSTVSLTRVIVADAVKRSLDHWEAKQWDAAMQHACNAVDGTGNKRYPQLGVAGRFKHTVRDSLDIFRVMTQPGIDFDQTRFPVAVKSDLPDGRPDIADVLYAFTAAAAATPTSCPRDSS